MQVGVELHARKRGQSVVQEQQVNLHVLHEAKHLGTIRGQEHAMRTCLLNGSLQKSGVLCIAFPNEDGFSYEQRTCTYAAGSVASIAPEQLEVLVQCTSKFLGQSSVHLLGLAIVLLRLEKRCCARRLPLHGAEEVE